MTVTKQRHHKTATTTKQRLLQNGDYYKMTTVAKKYFYKFNKNNFVIFYKTEKVDLFNARMYRGQTPAVG